MHLFTSKLQYAAHLSMLIVCCLFLQIDTHAQCINQQFTTATLTENDFGQSFTIPSAGCTELVSLVIQRRDGPSNNLNALTATFELFAGETISGTPLYTQTAIAISAGAGNKTINLSGGTGSLSVTPNVQYTWYLTLSDGADWRLGQGSSGDTYAGGRAYVLSSFRSDYDLDMIINSVAPNTPVDLVFFEAKSNTTTIDLNWQTASEEDNEGFEIERSADGKSWEIIDFVLGEGTSVQTNNYQYTDDKPLLGLNYYRLKQVDFDGDFEYSSTKVVKFKSEEANTSIYPNLVKDQLHITNGEGIATIYNSIGQLVETFAITNEQASVELTHLKTGQYVLHIQRENGNFHVERFVK